MALHNTNTLPDYFVTSEEIPWLDRVKTQAVMQKHVDTAISSTINLPYSATKEDVAGIYLEAWKRGIKGITIFRNGCKRAPILSKEKSDENKSSDSDETIQFPDRGHILETSDNVVGKKRKLMTGCGSLHVTAFFDPVSGDLMETYLSKGSTGGCNNYMTGLSRIISLAARGGCSIDSIIDQLQSCGVCPSYAVRRATKHDTSPGSCCPMAVGNALMEMWEEMQNEIKIRDSHFDIIRNSPLTEITITQPCPECGHQLLHEGGCDICKNCGWSKCG